MGPQTARPSQGGALQTASPDWDRQAVVEALRHSRDVSHNIRHLGRLRPPPSRQAIAEAVQGVTTALFPAHYGQQDLTPDTVDAFVERTLERALAILAEQVGRSLPFEANEIRGEDDIQREAGAIIRGFAASLPGVRNLLVSDLRAAHAGDPAANGYSEILLVYPGLTAIVHHRMAHALHGLGARFMARLASDIARGQTGIDIHPGARIDGSFFIDHGTGVVIGETAVIGKGVRLYQAVTLGARNFRVDKDGGLVKGELRHPVIEDDVVVYAGATILGRITVGKGSVIGGNVWLTHDVPPHSHVRQARLQENGFRE